MVATQGAAGMLVALACMGLVWTRTLALEQSLWGDELFSVRAYIERGPSGIFGRYVPNDHMLFELLEWIGTAVSGDHGAAAYRFWAVVPAIVAATLLTWWLWRRLDRWVAAIFAVLATSSPLFLDLGTEGRGYGLGFLAGAAMVIAADRFAWTHSRGSLALLALAALAGIWTLPLIVLPFLGVAGVLMAHRALRRRVLIAVALVGVASLLFYLPVLGDVISSSSQQVGARLSWHAVLTGPVRDLLAPSVSLLLAHASAGVGEAIAGVLLAIGLAALWHRPERLLALLLFAPAVFTYLILKLGGFYVVASFDGHSQLSTLAIEDRFTSFLLLPLLVGMAVGVVELGRWLAKVSVSLPMARPGSVWRLGSPVGAARSLSIHPLGPLVLLGAVVLSLFALGRIDSLARHDAEVPLESYAEVGAIVRRTGIWPVVTNSTHRLGLKYYIDPSGRHVRTLSPAALEAMFCSRQAGFIYIEHPLYSPHVNTTCLHQRGAVAIEVPERRDRPITVYVLPEASLAP
jgi:hypothetical protein